MVTIALLAVAGLLVAGAVMASRARRRPPPPPPSEDLAWQEHDCGGPDVED